MSRTLAKGICVQMCAIIVENFARFLLSSHSMPLVMMCSLMRRVFRIPHCSWKIQYHRMPEIAPGMAQGIRTTARMIPRPTKWVSRSRPTPSETTTMIGAVMAMKTSVFTRASRK